MSLSVPNLRKVALRPPVGCPTQYRQYIARNAVDYTGARGMGSFYADTAAVLRSSAPHITDVVLNVPLKRINDDYGHGAGDKHLIFICQQTYAYVKKRGFDATLYRDGANFVVRLNDNSGPGVVQDFMRGLSEYFSGKGIEVNVAGYTYTARDTTESLSAVDLRMWLLRAIYKVNQGEGKFQMEAVDPALAKSLNVANRVVDGIDTKRAVDAWPRDWKFLRSKLESEEDAREIYVEPDSGLLNRKAFEVLAQEMVVRARASGEKLSIGFFDGNKFGSFAKPSVMGGYGFLGSQVVDVVIQKRISSAAQKAFGRRGITFARLGSGSEEFVLIGRASKSEMAAAMAEFQSRLNDPLMIKATVGELRQSDRGREYLEKLKFDASRADSEQIEVDVTEMLRGPNGEYAGLSVTGAYATVLDDGISDPGKVVESNYRRVDGAASRAKAANPKRKAMIIRADLSQAV